MADEAWYIDEQTVGEGSRPDWLKPKYKSVFDQAKAYLDAEKRLGGMTGAPDQYDLSSFSDAISSEDETVKGFLDFAKSNNMNSEVVNKAFELAVSAKNSAQIDELKELEKLGNEGPRKREIIDQWVSNGFSSQGKEAFEKAPKTAEFIQLMDELRQRESKMRSATPQNSDIGSSFKVETENGIRQEMRDNYDRYRQSPAYREEISQRLALVLGEN